MLITNKTSYLILRLGLAFIFLWFGTDKLIHPNYWINTWIPQWLSGLLSSISIKTLNYIYIQGVFEIAIGLGFMLNTFIRIFAFLASLFLLLIILNIGINEVTIRDIGLLSGTLTILFWQTRRPSMF